VLDVIGRGDRIVVRDAQDAAPKRRVGAADARQAARTLLQRARARLAAASALPADAQRAPGHRLRHGGRHLPRKLLRFPRRQAARIVIEREPALLRIDRHADDALGRVGGLVHRIGAVGGGRRGTGWRVGRVVRGIHGKPGSVMKSPRRTRRAAARFAGGAILTHS